MTPTRARNWLLISLVLLLAGVGATWFYFFRSLPQEAWMRETPEMRFKYGSIGGEDGAGIPYWIVQALPRVFPDKFPGPGGYASLGVAWEQGHDLPVGFTRRVIGFERVGNNCAVCHTTRYRLPGDVTPRFVVAGPGNTLNVEAFFRLLVDCAKDPRFNADTLMSEINAIAQLSLPERAIYRFVLIPVTRQRLLEREAQFKWIYRHDFPEWGRGRDDAMNLTKYFMIKEPMDDTFGPTDMPSIWNLDKYKPEKGHLLNLAGDSHDAQSVIIDSALGLLGAPPADKDAFMGEMHWLRDYLGELKAPKYPLPIDAALAAQGKPLFDANCARCHASDKTGVPMPAAEVGTDPDRIASWKGEYAVKANNVVKGMGIERKGLVEADPRGYVVSFLDGIWLRGPYLHNGSVPTLRDLLKPAIERPQVFFRGDDEFDAVNVGFVSAGPEAERFGTRYDTRLRGNSNQGHEYGVGLSDADKSALIEYLKTL